MVDDPGLARWQGKGSARYLKSGANLFFDQVTGGNGVLSWEPTDRSWQIRDTLSLMPPGEGLVVSNEEWAGHPFSGGVYGEIIGRRIKESFPDAKILILLREQRKLAFSTYVDYVVRHGGTASLRRFLAPGQVGQVPQHNIQFYRFSHMVNWYYREFGQRNVMVLPAEILFAQPEDTLRRILGFIGAEAGDVPSMPGTENRGRYGVYCAHRLLPFLNLMAVPAPTNGYATINLRWVRSTIREVAGAVMPDALQKRIIGRDRRMIERALAEVVTADNGILQTLVSHDLRALGYLMPEPA
ncbi:sulfotransferase [Roseicyclus persicicus]|uniref:sulfotransferase n=1 Tax=Roseicyclus persicicus TaxID=2650661 RepID=UPI001447BC25